MDNVFLLIFGMTIWTSFITCFLRLLRKKKCDLKWMGMHGVLAVYLLCLFRSVQLADFNRSRPVFMPQIFNVFYKTIVLNKYQLFMISFSIEQVLYVIWLFVACIRIAMLWNQYRMIRRMTTEYPICEEKQVLYALERAMGISGKQCNIIVQKWEMCRVPAVFGLRKKVILLPDRIYDNKELSYIFMHEIAHICNHDLEVNMILQIWIRIFWWNPLFYMLVKDLEELMELRCDQCAVRQMDRTQKADYLETLVLAAKYAENSKKTIDSAPVSFFTSFSDDNILERFQLVANEGAACKTKKSRSLIVAVLSISFCLCSYCFMPMSWFETPLEEIECDGAVQVTPKELFILHTEDDNYYPLYNGQVYDQALDDESLADFISNGYQVIENANKEMDK